MKPRTTTNKFIKNKNPEYRKPIKSIYINKRNITGKRNYYIMNIDKIRYKMIIGLRRKTIIGSDY